MSDTLDLTLDAPAEIGRIGAAIKRQVRQVLRKKGVVLGLSGGVDSSVCAALCVRALGAKRVLGLLMPERDSSPDSLRLGRSVAQQLGIEAIVEDLGPALEALGCYRRRDEEIHRVLPELPPGAPHKIVLPQDLLERSRLNVFSLVAEAADGTLVRARLPRSAFLGIVAATNMKQRLRKGMEYYHADRLSYAVVGTPNRLEYDQGFFVKNGDGAADLKPIAHLYKTQVYQLAEELGLPEEVCSARPSTDTYSLPQTQSEFYFCLPYEQMDRLLLARDLELEPEDAAEATGFSPEQVRRVYADIDGKRRTTLSQHLWPLLVEPVPAVRHEPETSER